MKAFIFVAIVASVAARGLDLDTLRLLKEKSLLTRPVVDDVLLKEKLMDKTVVPDVLEKVYPTQEKHLLKGLRREFNEDRVYSFEEIYNTELFQEYLRLPVFRQYIQYPSFQRYVASVYFQRFWQVPTFRQYFLNPVLFYKYIYPIVQLFHNEYNLPVNTIYGQDETYNQEMYQGLYDNLIRNRNALPYVYNNRYGLQYNREYTPYTTGTNYKFLLDKIYKTLFANEQVYGDVTEVKTDVKLLPGEKKVVVEPITGERKVVIEEPKIVDVKVAQKVEKVLPIDTIEKKYDDIELTERDLLVLRVLLRKNILTPEIYESIIRGQVHLYTVLRQIYGEHIDFSLDRHVVLLKVLLKEHVITPEIFEAVIRGHIEFITLLRQILRQERFNRFDVNDFVNEITRREHIRVPTFDYEVPTTYDYNTFNRFDRFTGNDRYNTYNNYYNKYYKYNTEIPTLRENLYERLPIRQALRDIVA